MNSWYPAGMGLGLRGSALDPGSLSFQISRCLERHSVLISARSLPPCAPLRQREFLQDTHLRQASLQFSEVLEAFQSSAFSTAASNTGVGHQHANGRKRMGAPTPQSVSAAPHGQTSYLIATTST